MYELSDENVSCFPQKAFKSEFGPKFIECDPQNSLNLIPNSQNVIQRRRKFGSKFIECDPQFIEFGPKFIEFDPKFLEFGPKFIECDPQSMHYSKRHTL